MFLTKSNLIAAQAADISSPPLPQLSHSSQLQTNQELSAPTAASSLCKQLWYQQITFAMEEALVFEVRQDGIEKHRIDGIAAGIVLVTVQERFGFLG